MKSLLCILALLISFSTTAQRSDTTICQLLVHPDLKGGLPMLKTPGDKTPVSISHNQELEDMLVLDVKAENDSMFYVVASLGITGTSYTGWVKKDTTIGIYGRGYSEGLILRQKPEYGARETNIGCHPHFMPVLRCSKGWVYVAFNMGSKKHSGWLSPDMQCANPYTTCN